MQHSQYLAFMALFAVSSALPLNINLGAYSPAFVVGDGEISLGGKESVTQVLGALQGAAVTGAGTAAAAPKAADTAGTQEQAASVAALGQSPTLSTGTDSTQVGTLATGAGLGNDLEPRIRPRGLRAIAKRMAEESVAKTISSRDLAGFDRALTFATTALTTGPKIELGTGAEGSGVGIIVGAGVNNGGAKAEAAGAEKAEKREAEPEKRTKVTTLFVRELQENAEVEAVEKRGVDSINLDASKAEVTTLQGKTRISTA